MAYVSRGRRPMERASKISHSEVINDPQVQLLIGQCALPEGSAQADIAPHLIHVPDGGTLGKLRAIVAIDGGYTEAPVKSSYPFATVAFYTFGPLLLLLKDLEELDHQRFIAPEDMAKLKKLQRYTLALPLRGIRLRNHDSLANTIRHVVYEFFAKPQGKDTEPLMVSLQWLLFREWRLGGDDLRAVHVRWCPNPECAQQDIEFVSGGPTRLDCPGCGKPIYLTDTFRLHERIDEEQGAGGIGAYVLGLAEQMLLVHLIRALLNIKPALLAEVLFIKDGPLAFFGLVAPLYQPMRELTQHLVQGEFRLRLVGVEKTGAFVEHAIAIRDQMKPSSALICTNEYIYRYVIPGDPLTALYGSNTYYGHKVIYRGASGEMYVVNVVPLAYKAQPTASDIPELEATLRVIGRLRCNMYDNALIPVALANKLVSLSDFPSQRILATFARDAMAGHK